MGKKYMRWVIIWIVVVIFYWLFHGWILIERWPWYTNDVLWERDSYSFEIDEIRSVTGTLLITTDDFSPWKQRKEQLLDESEFFKWWVYHITLDAFDDYLTESVVIDRPVQIMLENKKYKQYRDDFGEIQWTYSWTSVQFMSDEQIESEYQHAKTFINQRVAVIQTANLTYSSFHQNREHFFFTYDQSIRESLTALFEADRSWKSLSSDLLHPNLVVCPLNCRETIEELLQWATESIWMQQQYLEDPSLIQLVRDKAARSSDIDIRLSLSTSDHNYPLARYFGSQKVRIIKKPYIHTKTILVDDQYLLLGSMNLSTNSLDNNREIWIIITERSVIDDWKKQFLEDWNE